MRGSLSRRKLLATTGALAAASAGGLATTRLAGTANARQRQPARIDVDAQDPRGRFFNAGWYINHPHPNWYFSRGLLPERTMAQLRDEFNVRWCRVFVRPDRYYDPETGEYDLAVNYPYLDQAASYSQRLLVCFSSPDIAESPELWEEILRTTLLDYKRRYPTIDCVVPWNEPNLDSTGGGLTPAEFYPFYRAGYRAVNAVNAELAPEIPLTFGGPGTSKLVDDYITEFLQHYASDPDPEKKLDFFTFQTHTYRDNPERAQGEKGAIRELLRDAGLNPDLPAYVTEFGVYSGADGGDQNGDTPEEDLHHDQLVQAAGTAMVSRYFMLGGMNRPFHWVVHHGQNVRKDMFVEGLDGVRLPFGHVLVMQGMLKPQLDGERLSTAIDPPAGPEGGIGLGAISHVDSDRLATMYWNYQAEPGTDEYDVQITVHDLPEELFGGKRIRVQRWLVDATHNNYNYDGSTEFTPEEDSITATPRQQVIRTQALTKNAVGLMLLTPVDRQSIDSRSTVDRRLIDSRFRTQMMTTPKRGHHLLLPWLVPVH